MVALGGIIVVNLGLADLDPAGGALNIDLHVEHVGGEVEATVHRRRHKLEANFAADRLQIRRYLAIDF